MKCFLSSYLFRRGFAAALSCYVVATCGGAHAESRELAPARAAVDAVLLVDASGSMLKTDPQMLRYEGAKLFLKFMGNDDRLAVVSFADKANVVSPLRAFSPAQVADISRQIQEVKTEGQYSDLFEGIRAAERVLDASPRNDAERIIVLLSDGKMEPHPSVSMPATRSVELVNQVLPDLKTKEIKVHSLAFSNQADRSLLGEISAATDGLNWFTTTSDDVHKSFADLFLVVKRPQVLPMRSRAFMLDDNVQEATFYVTRDEGTKLILISPKGNSMTVENVPDWVTWFAGKNFDVITMREPDIGEWQVQSGGATEGFATVLTNLKLVTDWPVIVRAHDEQVVQARLYDGDKPVALPEMSGVVNYAFQVMPTDRVAAAVAKDFLNDDGRDGDRVAKDGIFSKRCILTEPGEYKLSIVARGPTFERSQQVPFRVRPRLVEFEVLPGSAAAGHEHEDISKEHAPNHSEGEGGDAHTEDSLKGDQSFVMRATISKEAMTFRDVEVRVEALSSERKKSVIRLTRSSEDSQRYEALADNLPSGGTYSLKATITGVSKKNQEVEGESPVVRFQFAPTAKRVGAAPTAAPKEPVHEQKSDQPVPILPIVLVTLANVLAIGAGIVLTKRKKASLSSTSRYHPPKQMLDSIANLEERLSPSYLKIGEVELEPSSEEVAQGAASEGASVSGSEVANEATDAPTEPSPSTEQEASPAASKEA